MQNYDELMTKNLEWIDEKLEVDADYFKNLSVGQNPPFLYIGCSDSRMPVDTFTKSELGSFFIHRNIANQVLPNDINFLTTLEYAVEQLEVEHIIVSGHYECNGIKKACEVEEQSSIMSSWLMPIKRIKRENKDMLDTLETEQKKLDKLTELNVLEQLKHLFSISILKNKISSGKYPKIHGWILDIRSGRIIEIKIPIAEWKAMGIIQEEYNT